MTDIYIAVWSRSREVVHVGTSLDDAKAGVEKHRLEAFMLPQPAPRWDDEWVPRRKWEPRNLVSTLYGFVNTWDSYNIAHYEVQGE